MFKSLIRTIPSLSGCAKLACLVNDINKIDKNNNLEYEAFIKNARLVLSDDNISQGFVDVSLLESSYEYDIKRFFLSHSDTFFNHTFVYNKSDYTLLDKYNTQYQRNTDFEFGTKRLLFSTSGFQFAFDAPIYIDGINDIPDYFELSVHIKNNFHTTTRTLRININEKKDDIKNYIYVYLKNYASKINDNFVFIKEDTKQLIYWGVDLKTGGFVRKVDNLGYKLLDEETTINNFDNIISNGWKRNNIITQQIIPLTYYININQLFADSENDFSNSEFTIEGAYYKNGVKIQLSDFDINYHSLYPEILKFDKSNGKMKYSLGKINVFDDINNTINEKNYIGYRYANKFNILYNRWKLKYSSNNHPYITNMSRAMSINQDSNYKYGTYPEPFISLYGISNINNNFIAPVGDLLKSKSSAYYNKKTLALNYENVMNKYATTWYNITKGVNIYYIILLKDISDIDNSVEYFKYNEETFTYSLYSDEELREAIISSDNGLWVYYKKNIFNDYIWSDTLDGKIFFKGILYDLNNIFNKIPNKYNIDKFGVFVKLNFNIISKEELQNIKSVKYSLLTNPKYVNNPNCNITDSLYGGLREYSNVGKYTTLYDLKSKVSYTCEKSNEKTFIKDNSGDCEFINLSKYGCNYYDINKYRSLSHIKNILNKLESSNKISNSDNKKIYNDLLSISVQNYEFLPFYYNSSLIYDENNNFITCLEEIINGKILKSWIYDRLYIGKGPHSTITEYNYLDINEVKNDDKYSTQFFIKDNFIHDTEIIEYIKKVYPTKYDLLYTNIITTPIFEYHPNLSYESITISKNVFVRRDNEIGENYCEDIPVNKVNVDNDVIYVDNYNINKIITNFNEKYGTNYKKYSNVKTSNYKYLDDTNSKTLYAKILNKEHLHYYITTLSAPGYYYSPVYIPTPDPMSLLHIRCRFIIDDKNNNDITVKDKYVSFENIFENTVTRKNNLLFYFKFKNGVFNFSKKCISLYGDKIKELFEFDNNFDLSTFTFDIVYRDIFIKLDEELYNILHLEDDDKLYKDMYLYAISKPYEYHSLHKLYYRNNIDNLNNYVDTTQSASPLFDDVKIQDKEESVVYKKFQSTRISKSRIGNSDNYRYRYMCEDILCMLDISEYENMFSKTLSPYPIVVENDGINTYYYSTSYATTYLMNSGYDLFDTTIEENINNKKLEGYKLLDNSYSYFEKAADVNFSKNKVISYSYKGEPETRENITFTYYSEKRFNKLFKNNWPSSYTYDNGTYIVQNISKYTYIPDINVYTYVPSYSYSYYDDLGLFEEFGLNTYTSYYTYNVNKLDSLGNIVSSEVQGKTTYGFYMINATVDNSSGSFNLVDEDMIYKKYFTKIDGVDLYSEHAKDIDLSDKFNMFVPFSKLNMFNTLKNNANTIITPAVYDIKNEYKNVSIQEGSYYTDIIKTHNGGHILYERYFDMLSPVFKDTSNIDIYNIKFKDTNLNYQVTYTNDMFEMINTNLYQYAPINVYDRNNKIIYQYYPFEYKHFNANKYINLDTEFSIEYPNLVTYEGILLLKTEENILKVFKEYINNNGKHTFSDDEILFLHNRYNIKIDIENVGLTQNKAKNLYKVTYKFNLL